MTSRNVEGVSKAPDVLFAAGIVAILFVILVPLPTPVIDILLAMSMALSVVVLLTVVMVREPLRFSVFPSVLLLATAYRLALNVATTRLILGAGPRGGTASAGEVIRSFGDFVAGSEPAVGFALFLILVIVNFLVITKGANRVSEVTARFMLDALPGKQMAIDAEVKAGLLREEDVRRRREAVGKEADFYGAMDGATRFLRGDAIASLLITALNLIGGFLVGTLQHGMSAGAAWRTFTVLTIGDGLAAQVPAVLVSLGAGLLVTRASSEAGLGRQFWTQIFSERRALLTAAGCLLLLVPAGLPAVPLAIAASVLGLAAWAGGRRAPAAPAPVPTPERPPEKIESLLHLESLELELGRGLLKLTNPSPGGTLLEGIAQVRRELASELGLVVPPVRVRDRMSLGAHEYSLRIRGVPVARGPVPLQAPGPALLASLKDAIRHHAAELLTRDDVDALLKHLRETRPAVVEEVVPAIVKPGELQKVLRNLLREGVSIRDLGTILEATGDAASRSRDPETMTEHVRQALAGTLCAEALEGGGRLAVIALDPALEARLRADAETALSPSAAERIAARIGREAERAVAAGWPPILLCSPAARPQARRLAELVSPNIRVLSTNELRREVRVEAVATVTSEAEG
ncbi:MAG: FHIPEP family type III secretion protein [Planctomycetes bacterium]|nr:FHIPEP family type III secretion protein [Planctomycetota bacterium]